MAVILVEIGCTLEKCMHAFQLDWVKNATVLKLKNYTVADYRRFTVRLQLKTLLPCILLLTFAIKVQLRKRLMHENR